MSGGVQGVELVHEGKCLGEKGVQKEVLPPLGKEAQQELGRGEVIKEPTVDPFEILESDQPILNFRG